MQILIPDSWLRDFLKTDANPKDLANSLSLCGPTVDRIKKEGNDHVYDIEVTTNRVDAMSVVGIAREANAILPRFGFKSKYKKLRAIKIPSKNKLGIKIVNNPKLCHRILAVKISNVKIGKSPKLISDRLTAVGQRPLNNLVDITNYVMWEVGHPTHVFDYDKLASLGGKIVVREAKKGENITSFDGKKYKLNGGEVIFDNGNGEIIDLPGIIGTKNSVVSKSTKNILFFIESTDHRRIRLASMGLGIRTNAAILNEKQVDPELAMTAILRGIDLYEKYTGGKVSSQLFDVYPKKSKTNEVTVNHDFIIDRLGVDITKNEISKILSSLEIIPKWSSNNLKTLVPTFRHQDIKSGVDIVEEVARVYGYNSLPGKMIDTKLPEVPDRDLISFERRLRDLMSSLGAIEVLTQSLVSEYFVDPKKALKIKNPLGKDTSFLRSTLMPSLLHAAKTNKQQKEPFHIFEISNVYRRQNNDLPIHVSILGGVFSDFDYRVVKGLIESMLNRLNINYSIKKEDKKGFMKSRRITYRTKKDSLGELGMINDSYIYYSFDVNTLHLHSKKIAKFEKLPKYPPQIEDLTLVLPKKTIVIDVIQTIEKSHDFVKKVKLKDIFDDAYTFSLEYQSNKKTLTNEEVDKIRNKVIEKVKSAHSAISED